MHFWGDKDVDWDGIDNAASYIGEGLRRYGRVQVVQYKEKYGTVRVYTQGLGVSMLHQLWKPGHVYNRYPFKWMWAADLYLGQYVCKILNVFFIPYHKWLYRRYYKKAIKKWPHLRVEILNCADYTVLLKGL